MSKRLVKVLFLLLVVQSAVAQSGISHSILNDLLQQNVSAKGAVDYKTLKSQKAKLDEYCKSISEVTPKDTWTKQEKLAFWMNAYNAFTIDLIVSNYPIKSITALDNEKTWDVKRIKIGGKKYSLNDIENNILRKLGDARIHFGINCAAKSCPPLGNEAFTPENVEAKLEAATKKFINDKTANQLTAKSAKVSKIFKWYAADFPNLIAFLNKYSTTKINKSAVVDYQDYDWSLNGK
jgi:hypothetical protein